MCTTIISEKDKEILDLIQLIGKISVPISDSIQSSTAPSTSIGSISKYSFEDFGKNFTPQQLVSLREVGPSIRDDSTFVALALKNLYVDRLQCLQSKSLTGRSKNGEIKTAITPEKVTVLKNIFIDRIDGLTIDVHERKKRKKRINVLIKDGLGNISKSIISIEKEKEVCRRLNFNKE